MLITYFIPYILITKRPLTTSPPHNESTVAIQALDTIALVNNVTAFPLRANNVIPMPENDRQI